MNQWYAIRRLRGPAFLILIGILLLLEQCHIMNFGKSWPLLLILGGLLRLAERAAWTAGLTAEQAQQQCQPYASASTWQASSTYAPPAPAAPAPNPDTWHHPDDPQNRESR